MMHGLFIPAPNHELNLAPLKNVPGASSAGSVRVVSGSGFRYVVPFPFRLHEMLCNVESKNNGSIVSWLPDGNHFKVHDPRRFVEVVIPSAFKQKSLKSFQRQLHLYGFQRVHEGPDKGAYFHEKFLRNDRDLSLTISRTKAPKRSRIVPTKSDDPNKKFVSNSRKRNNIDTNTVNGGGESQSQQSSHILSDDNIFSMKRPLHNPTSSNSNINGNNNSLASPSKVGSTSGLTFGSGKGLHHEEAIADTCEWLIKNGVPISAFDPVAIAFDPVTIDDISNSTCNVPRSANAGCDITSLFSGGSPSSNYRMEMMTSSRSINEDSTRNSSSIMTNTQQATPIEVLSLNPVSVSPSYQIESHYNISYSTTDSREEYPLRTDLLPGEMLPSIDDALWAL